MIQMQSGDRHREPPDELILPTGQRVTTGDHVRLHPRAGSDIFDLALTGRAARIMAIEQDVEGRQHVGVIFDDDPGLDLGMRRQPGHHFFFAPDEVELLDADASANGSRRRMLVAGIGNVLMGDDGFGVEVAQLLATRPQPSGVRVFAAGIRGFDLAYAILEEPDHIILVDACARGMQPGAVSLLEIDTSDALKNASSADAAAGAAATVPDGQSMDPVSVLRLAHILGARPKHVMVVGCEPLTLGLHDRHTGLSEVVARAVPAALGMVEALISQYAGSGAVAGAWRTPRC